MTKSEFKRRAESLHKQSIKVKEGMNNLLYDLEEMGVDLFASSDAENADDITTAIQCYITYSEYNLDSIWEEIKANEKMDRRVRA
jgi:hypothetical protein